MDKYWLNSTSVHHTRKSVLCTRPVETMQDWRVYGCRRNTLRLSQKYSALSLKMSREGAPSQQWGHTRLSWHCVALSDFEGHQMSLSSPGTQCPWYLPNPPWWRQPNLPTHCSQEFPWPGRGNKTAGVTQMLQLWPGSVNWPFHNDSFIPSMGSELRLHALHCTCQAPVRRERACMSRVYFLLQAWKFLTLFQEVHFKRTNDSDSANRKIFPLNVIYNTWGFKKNAYFLLLK